MFSLVQLECFVAVAEELHFGAAAARLRMTQPPLSRQIQLLERELDALLFTRTSRKVELTSAGATLLPNARRLLDIAAKTATDVRRVSEGAAGTLAVAYTAMAAQSALPLLVRRTAAELPGVNLGLRELVSTDQMDALMKGTVDIGLLRPMVARSGIRTRAILIEKLVVAVPGDSQLAEVEGPIALHELDRRPVLMYSPSTARYFHDLLLALFVSSGIRPDIVQYAGQIPALLALVQAGLGSTLVPQSARNISPDGVVFRELKSGTPSDALNKVELDVAWSEDTTNPLVGRVVDMLSLDVDVH